MVIVSCGNLLFVQKNAYTFARLELRCDTVRRCWLARVLQYSNQSGIIKSNVFPDVMVRRLLFLLHILLHDTHLVTSNAAQ